MSTYAVQGETLGLIADAIRGKLGTDEPMEVSSMASMIEGIPSGGNKTYTLDINEDLGVRTLKDNANAVFQKLQIPVNIVAEITSGATPIIMEDNKLYYATVSNNIGQYRATLLTIARKGNNYLLCGTRDGNSPQTAIANSWILYNGCTVTLIEVDI